MRDCARRMVCNCDQITRKRSGKFHFDLVRFFRAALAPFLPRAVRVSLCRRAIVFFRRAAAQRRRFRVLAAFFAAAERDCGERCRATRFACLDNACFDADRRLSRLSARFVARERFREGFLRDPERPFARSRFAWRFVRCGPRFGGGNFTPARRALERPMAIACSGERAPCLPSRMCSISSRTNSPA